MKTAAPKWLPFLVGASGVAFGFVLLPMRWWRHGDFPIAAEILVVASLVLSAPLARGGLWRRALALGGWTALSLILADFVADLWCAQVNPEPLARAAGAWAVSIVFVVLLLALETWNRATQDQAPARADASLP